MIIFTYEVLLDRSEYFNILGEFLKSSNELKGIIKNVQEIREASVPIFKFKCFDIKVDFIFACS